MILLVYATDQKYPASGLEYFVKSEFEREPLMLDKQMISHFKPLDVGSKIHCCGTKAGLKENPWLLYIRTFSFSS